MNWSNIRVLVCANSDAHRKLVQQILLAIDINQVLTCGVIVGARNPVNTGKVDLLIGQLTPKDTSILDVVKWLRDPRVTPVRGVPILVSVATTDRRFLTPAIKAGVDLLVAEPLSIEKLKKRIVAVTSNPPQRLSTCNYYGPCRRRVPTTSAPYSGTERRAARKTSSPQQTRTGAV